MPLIQWGSVRALGQGMDKGVFGIDPEEGTKIQWENKVTGKQLNIPNEQVQEAYWQTIPSGCKLLLLLPVGVAVFTGFKLKTHETLKQYFAARCDDLDLVDIPLSTDGLHAGILDSKHNEVQLTNRSGEQILCLNMSRVKNCAVPLANEVEMQMDTDDMQGDDEYTEMIRFLVSPDVDGLPNAEEICQDVRDATNMSAGDAIYEFKNTVGSFLVPRGKYAIEMYADHVRLHGTTYVFHLDYTNIIKLYMLPDPKTPSNFLVFCLRDGLQQGHQVYPYLVLKVKEEVQLVQSCLTQAELDEQFGTKYNETEKRNESNLLERTEEEIYKVIAKCFSYIAKVKVYKTSDYISAKSFKAVMSAVGNSDGLLYPLTKGLMYLHKPTLLIPYKSTIETNFLRLHDKSARHTFDMEVSYVDGAGAKQVTVFKHINKDEYTNISEFLRRKKVTLKIQNDGGPDMVNSKIIDEQLGEDTDDDSEDDEEFTEAQARAEERHSSSDEDSFDEDGDGSSDSEVKPKKKRSKKEKKSSKASRKRKTST
jgi:structure-specific recognition protein 1